MADVRAPAPPTDLLDALLAELRAHLLAMESGKIMLNWHWGKLDVKYEVTAVRHLTLVATAPADET